MDGPDPATQPGNTLARITAGPCMSSLRSGSMCAVCNTGSHGERLAARILVARLALVIDGIDGTFARIGKVEARLPRFSGERLDQVIDYITYVFIPVLALL